MYGKNNLNSGISSKLDMLQYFVGLFLVSRFMDMKN